MKLLRGLGGFLALIPALAATFAPGSLAGSRADATARLLSTFRLYQLDGVHGARLMPVDPLNLSLVKHGKSIPMSGSSDSRHLSQVLSSGDGRTLVAVQQRDGIVRVMRPDTGTLLHSFRLPANVDTLNLTLSRDGSRLFTSQKFALRQPNRPQIWYDLSTNDGRVLNRITLARPCCALAQYDQRLDRLLVLQAPKQPMSNSDPGPPTLIAYDAASGQLVRSVILAGVRYGGWPSGTDRNGDRQFTMWTLGFALSPDESQIAIFDDSSGRITFVSPSTLKVTATAILRTRQSAFETVVAWLGLAPSEALAKDFRGANVEMRYSPDGQLLYVTGTEFLPGVHSQAHSIGIRAIDVPRRQWVGQALKRQTLWWTQASPDGNALYSLGPITADAVMCPCVLRRHNPVTLQVMAKSYIWRYANPKFFVLQAP